MPHEHHLSGGMVAMAWRVAKALVQLREQIDEQWPYRNRASDGTIGDAAHASRDSDHNPWVKDGTVGVVTATDITHGPDGGPNCHVLAQQLVESRDPRIKYLIWNRRICGSYPADGKPAWTWRPYNGANPHTKHLHVSVQPGKAKYDSTAPWKIGTTSPAKPEEDDVTPQDIEKVADRVVEKLLNTHLRNPNYYPKDTPTASFQTWLTYRLARTDEMREIADRLEDYIREFAADKNEDVKP